MKPDKKPIGMIERLSTEREKEALRPKVAEVDDGPSLAYILNGPNSRFFGEMLAMAPDEEPREVAMRMSSGRLEERDLDLLEKYRNEFNKKMQTMETLEAEITPENLGLFAQHSEKFSKIIKLLGPEKAVRAIKSELRNLYFGDEESRERFAGIQKAIQGLTEYKGDKGEFAKIEKEIREKCKANNISEEDFEAAMQIKDVAERREKIEEMIKEKYGKVRKFGLAFSFGEKKLNDRTRELTVLAVHANEAIDQRIKNMEEKMKAVGEALFAASSKDDEFRQALGREILNEKHPRREPESGFNEVKQRMPHPKTLDREMLAAWDVFKADINNAYSDAMPESAKDSDRDRFITDYKRKHGNKFKGTRGFWGTMFTSMFDLAVDKRRDILK